MLIALQITYSAVQNHRQNRVCDSWNRRFDTGICKL